ncbi:hypothetical protein Pelo_19810 [Pelomyxa schiedti]|nr:hypothetical protein Pelo_19810 [Pelomyxa schiedti]
MDLPAQLRSAFTALVVEFPAEMRGCHQVTSLGRTSTDTHSPSLLSTTVIPKQTLGEEKTITIWIPAL